MPDDDKKHKKETLKASDHKGLYGAKGDLIKVTNEKDGTWHVHDPALPDEQKFCSICLRAGLT